jgi:hypothetical protein
VAVDGVGDVYVPDAYHVYKLPFNAKNGDAIPAIATGFQGATAHVALDGRGNADIADYANSQILRVALDGTTTVLANSTIVSQPTDIFDAELGVADLNVHLGMPVFTDQNDRIASLYPPNFALGFSTSLQQFSTGFVQAPCCIAGNTAGDFYLNEGSSVYQVRDSGGFYAIEVVDGEIAVGAFSLDSAGDIYLVGTLPGSQQTSIIELPALQQPFQFSNTNIGATTVQQFEVRNTGNASMTFTSVSASGSFTVSAVGTSCTTSSVLVPTASCVVSVTFAPVVGGVVSGNLAIAVSGLNPTPFALTGTGVAVQGPQATLAPVILTFGSQPISTTSSVQTVTLTNSGTAALASISIAATGDFAETSACPSALAAGANCTISVTFTPTVAGTRTGALTITDNASGSPQSVALTGTAATVSVSSGSTGLAVSSPGSSTTTTVLFSPSGGFIGTLNLSCSVTYLGQGTAIDLPTCSLNPSQATVSSGTVPSSTLTVSTTAASPSAKLSNSWRQLGGIAVAFLFLVLVPLRRRPGAALLVVMCIVSVGVFSGCSGGGSTTDNAQPANPGTTPGSYSVTVKATSGKFSASATIPLSIQ